ncbi:MAG: NADH-quinone oxidoreductase subunit A [Blastocatellales bacterium]|nr:NADH-quinone oxidoreductase subunit A [Blastocatellales bacterium]
MRTFHQNPETIIVNALLLFQQAASTALPGPDSATPPVFSYLPIALFLIVAAAFPGVALLVLRAVRPQVYGPQKMMPYECGLDPIRDARERFSVRFYIIAMLFLIFDVETVFLLPWAIAFDRLALFGLIEMIIFVGILVVGYYYAWRKGALNWV